METIKVGFMRMAGTEAKSATKSVRAQNTKPEGTEIAGRPRAKMPVQDGARRFLPFTALKRLSEVLAGEEQVVVFEIILTEDMSEELNRGTQQVESGIIISAVYFHKDERLRVTGAATRLNTNNRVLQVISARISFDDVLDIKLCR